MPDPDIETSIRAAVDGLRGRRTPHELARMLRQLAQELDDEAMAPGTQAFVDPEVTLEDAFGTMLVSMEGSVERDLDLES